MADRDDGPETRSEFFGMLARLSAPLQTFDQDDAIQYAGLSRFTRYLLYSAGNCPIPSTSGSPLSWRCRELDAWTVRLRPLKCRRLRKGATG
jgi:hypothetical protein